MRFGYGKRAMLLRYSVEIFSFGVIRFLGAVQRTECKERENSRVDSTGNATLLEGIVNVVAGRKNFFIFAEGKRRERGRENIFFPSFLPVRRPRSFSNLSLIKRATLRRRLSRVYATNLCRTSTKSTRISGRDIAPLRGHVAKMCACFSSWNFPRVVD